MLEPTFPPWRTAMAISMRLHKAFADFSSRFGFENLDIYVLFGDFAFVHKPTGVEVIVEAKGKHCYYDLEGEATYMHHHQYVKGFDGRMIFSWRVQWDFLFTEHISEDKALFLPRDLIPKDWWNASSGSGKMLKWPTEKPRCSQEIHGRSKLEPPRGDLRGTNPRHDAAT